MHLFLSVLSVAAALAYVVHPIADSGLRADVALASFFGCNGCHATTQKGTGGGGLSFPSEPDLLNGQCTGEPGHCTGSACSLSGRLALTNNTHTTLYWSTDGGRSMHELLSGDTEAIYFNDDSVECSTEGDTKTTYTFYTNHDGTGQLAGAYYTMACSKCEG
jgi:hypothetical protein